jgi:Skp family chaperone for outer membrane proteins
MKRLATLAVCAAALLANPVPAQEKVRIGFVDGFRIENESAQARRALAVLNQEFETRYSELDALRRKIATARQALIGYQKANPYKVRFTVDRMGVLAHARFLEPPETS